jgi:hypothetical protein
MLTFTNFMEAIQDTGSAQAEMGAEQLAFAFSAG